MHGLAGADEALVGAVASWAAILSTGRGEIGIVDALPDQAPFGGFFGGQLFRQEGEAHGAGHADPLGQEPGAAGIGDEADLGKAWRKEADLAAITRSQARATEAPAPAAMPLTAAMVGTRRFARRRTRGL